MSKIFYISNSIVPVDKKRISALDFMEKFTESEQIDVIDAAQNNKVIRLFWQKLKISNDVSLDDDRLKKGVAALIDAGLVEPIRFFEIFGSELENSNV